MHREAVADGDGEDYEDDAGNGDGGELGAGADFAGDERRNDAANEHEQPVDGGNGGADCHAIFGDAGCGGVGEVEDEHCGDADFHTYVAEDADYAEHGVAEVPGGVCVFFTCFGGLGGLGDVEASDHEEGDEEDGHADEHERGHIGDVGVFGDLAYEHTYDKRGECAGERVERTAHLHELVAAVAASAEEVEHGVDHGVEDTY